MTKRIYLTVGPTNEGLSNDILQRAGYSSDYAHGPRGFRSAIQDAKLHLDAVRLNYGNMSRPIATLTVEDEDTIFATLDDEFEISFALDRLEDESAADLLAEYLPVS